MNTIDLYTADGERVTVVLPRSPTVPDVLVWGQRTFSKNASGRYCEITSVCVFTQSEIEDAAASGLWK